VAAVPAPVAAAPAAAAAAAPIADAPVAPSPVAAAHVPAPAAPARAVAAVAPAPAAQSSVAVAAPPQPSAPTTSGTSAADTVLGIIADKTGYPVEALAREMDLEADLGIDSIKRVEILSAVSREMPSLNTSAISPADIRRISDLLALLEGAGQDPQLAAAR
jgi:hypothetical protein